MVLIYCFVTYCFDDVDEICNTEQQQLYGDGDDDDVDELENVVVVVSFAYISLFLSLFFSRFTFPTNVHDTSQKKNREYTE